MLKKIMFLSIVLLTVGNVVAYDDERRELSEEEISELLRTRGKHNRSAETLAQRIADVNKWALEFSKRKADLERKRDLAFKERLLQAEERAKALQAREKADFYSRRGARAEGKEWREQISTDYTPEMSVAERIAAFEKEASGALA